MRWRRTGGAAWRPAWTATSSSRCARGICTRCSRGGPRATRGARATAAGPQRSGATPTAAALGFRFAELSETYGGEVGPVGALLGSFLAAAPAAVAGIGESLAAGDAVGAAAAAHGLKGISLTIGAAALAASCGALVEAGRRGDLAAARAAFTEVQRHWIDLKPALEHHLRAAP